MKTYDTILIGGGQSAMAVGFYLRRKHIDFIILDDQQEPGGAWLKAWDSLKLFSPNTYSSLPGWQMPKTDHEYPSKDEFISYLSQYEKRYKYNIQRNQKVVNVIKEGSLFKVETKTHTFYSKTVVSTTGNAQNPFIPNFKNREGFKGLQLHSVDYKNTQQLAGQKVLIVGGGNSGAQILAEVSSVAQTTWVTKKDPHFLPEHIDGRYLFNQATQSYYSSQREHPKQEKTTKPPSLSQIVQVETVREALNRDVFENARKPFQSFTETGVIWLDGTEEDFDAVIWCTGFRSNLSHLEPLNVIKNNRIETHGTRSTIEPNLWLVGYGSWTGFASATIYGVGKTAKATAEEVFTSLSK